MILVMGLGNPGIKFEKTRHNIGFRVADKFGTENNFPTFKLLEKFNAKISQGFLNDEKIIIAKSQTFMNESGGTAKRILKSYKLKATNRLWVIHDDIDLSLGKIKISIGRGSAGHKGVQSIIDELKNKNFVRFRIGIRPQRTKNKKQKTENFVLQKFDKKEEEVLKEVVERTCLVIEMAIKSGLEKAMNEFNK